MTLRNWWLFVGVTFVLSATPGPNMLLVLHTSARFGFKASLATMAGCMTALLAMFSLSALGLGAFFEAFPAGFKALRWAGAAYLCFLGVKSWFAPPERHSPQGLGEGGQPLPRPTGLFRGGMLVAASNPKAILFAASFLPQFIQTNAPALPQFALLLTTFAVVEVGWYLVYATCGRGLAGYLERPTVKKAFNRLTGGVFICFAGFMGILHG